MSAAPTRPATVTPADVIAFIEREHANTALGLMGIVYTSFDPDRVCAEVEVGPKLFRHGGVVHGGVFVLLGESVASTAAALRVDLSTHDVSGMEINANHVRPVSGGRLVCTATPRHRGRTTHVYDWSVRDGEGREVSFGRCTVAVRVRPTP